MGCYTTPVVSLSCILCRLGSVSAGPGLSGQELGEPGQRRGADTRASPHITHSRSRRQERGEWLVHIVSTVVTQGHQSPRHTSSGGSGWSPGHTTIGWSETWWSPEWCDTVTEWPTCGQRPIRWLNGSYLKQFHGRISPLGRFHFQLFLGYVLAWRKYSTIIAGVFVSVKSTYSFIRAAS